MLVFAGHTGLTKLGLTLSELGWGEMALPHEVPACRKPWALDNGAYRAWNRQVNGTKRRSGESEVGDFTQLLVALYQTREDPPHFWVAPDVIGGGRGSLELSVNWVLNPEHRHGNPAPAYLAVQDGMTPAELEPYLQHFGGIFVGGTTPWKLKTGHEWVRFAHAHHLPCHIGRCGSMKRIQWAGWCGADSIDSSLPLWSRRNLDLAMAGLVSAKSQGVLVR